MLDRDYVVTMTPKVDDWLYICISCCHLLLYYPYIVVILLMLYMHMLLLCLGPTSEGLLCKILAFCSSHQHTKAILKYPFGPYTLDMPSNWSFTAQISDFLLHWDPHHAWVSGIGDTCIYSAYMSTCEALPAICTLAWSSSESDQLHRFHGISWDPRCTICTISWGSMYRAYLEIQTSN